MSQDIIPQALHGDLYARWHSAIEYRKNRVYDPSFALASDPSVYERMLRIAWIRQAFDFRCKSVAGTDWKCEPYSDDERDVRAAMLVNGLLRHVDKFRPARERLAMACFYGSTYAEMRGEFQRIKLPGDTKTRRWYVVTQLKDVDKRRFGKFRSPDGVAEWKQMHPRTSMWETLDAPELYIKHVYEDREQYLGFGSGLADALYWTAYAYTNAMEMGLVGLKRWAKGVVKAKIGQDRMGDTSRENDDIVTEYVEKLLAMYERGVLAHGDTDEVDLLEAGGAGHEIVSSFIEALKSDGTRLILGSLRPTGGGGDMATGARAQAETEADMFGLLVKHDQMDLDETLTHDFVGYLMAANRPIFHEAGCKGANPPKIVTVTQSREDPTEAAANTSTLLAAGVPLVADDVYRKTGFKQPAAGDILLEPRPAQTALPGAFPFAAGGGRG